MPTTRAQHRSRPMPAAEPETALTLKLRSPADRESVAKWRQWGAPEDIILTCAANRQLDRLIEAHVSDRRHIVIACFVKSASTYLNNVLIGATDFRSYLLNTSGHDNERNIDPSCIPMFLALDTISQEHMRATKPNVVWLQKLQIKPVVLIRDIFDTIVSLADAIGNDDILIPNAHLPTSFAAWDHEQQLSLLVGMAAPWFLNFFASWQDAQSRLSTLWVTYDDVTQRTRETVRRIAVHTDIAMSAAQIETAISKVDLAASKFNRGVSGRGRNDLTESQRQWVRDLAATFNGAYDFSLIGL